MKTLLIWESDHDKICRNIASHKSTLKILLKTKDEHELLQGWFEHHARIVGAHNIIVADNGSTMPESVETLLRLSEECSVFTFRGFHNRIHETHSFPELYESIRKSSVCFVPIDTDERLYWMDGDTWFADDRVLENIKKRLPFDLLPAALVNNSSGKITSFVLPPAQSAWISCLRWGKPVVRAGLDFSGRQSLHNLQFDPAYMPKSGDVNLFCVHLTDFDPELRLRAQKNKLLSRGIVTASTSYEEIEKLPDEGFSGDSVIARVIRETRSILKHKRNPSSGGWRRTSPRHTVELLKNGGIKFGSQETKAAFFLMMEKGLDILRADIENASGGPVVVRGADVSARPQANLPADAAQAPHEKYANSAEKSMPTMRNSREEELRQGMGKEPDRLDKYGDPTFRKELIRYLLSEERWDEAEELVPEPGSPGTPGWHHILFARALEKLGRREEAVTHWKAFLANQPHHKEALRALNPDSVPLPSPLSAIAKKVPHQAFETIFDVGANIGQSCLVYAKALPKARIFAFEPVPASFAQLLSAIEPYSGITAHNLALSDRVGKIEMSASATSTMNRVVSSTVAGDIAIEAMTLEKFCEQNGVEHINFLKIDTEGHDLAVLRGCGSMLANVDFIQCEASANRYNQFHNSFSEIFEVLTDAGFFLFQIFGQTFEWGNGGYPVLRCFDPVFVNRYVVGEMRHIVVR